MTNMNSNVLQLREMLSSSPLLFPLEWNRLSKQVVFIGLKEAEYQQASFLDDRVDQVGAVKGRVPFELISELPNFGLNDVTSSSISPIAVQPCFQDSWGLTLIASRFENQKSSDPLIPRTKRRFNGCSVFWLARFIPNRPL